MREREREPRLADAGNFLQYYYRFASVAGSFATPGYRNENEKGQFSFQYSYCLLCMLVCGPVTHVCSSFCVRIISYSSLTFPVNHKTPQIGDQVQLIGEMFVTTISNCWNLL